MEIDWIDAAVRLGIPTAGAPDYDTQIAQADIDENFPDSGLTTSVLADAEFILSTIRGNMENAIVALTILAKLP